MIVFCTQLLPFLLSMVLGGRTIQRGPSASVLLSRLAILALLYIWVVAVTFTISNAPSGAVFLALFVIVSKVLALVCPYMLTVLFFPGVFQLALLIFTRFSPRATAFEAPGVAPILVANVDRERFDWLVLAAFLTRFHAVFFRHSVKEVIMNYSIGMQNRQAV
jgi:hypothetical protein